MLLGAAVVVAGGFGAAKVAADTNAAGVPYLVSVLADAQAKEVAKTNTGHMVMATTGKKAETTKVIDKKAATKKAAIKHAASAKAAAMSQPTATKTASSTSPSPAKAAAKPAAAQVAVKPAAAAPVRQVVAQTPAQRAAAKAASIRATSGETYVGTISGLGHVTDVIQGSMSRTTAPAQDGLAMTWGGATRLSTTDGLTSEIAGHAKTNTFSWIMGLGVGSHVSVTDASGNSRTYTVYLTDNVNDESYSVKNGADRYNQIISAGQGEAVVLQTCISSTVNRIVWAH